MVDRLDYPMPQPERWLSARWRRLWCPHYYEEAGAVSAIEREWRCLRGCGKRKVTSYGEIPFSVLLPDEAVVNDKLVRRRA